MANRLSSTAMMGIPTFLKVSRGLRGLRKAVMSAERRRQTGGVCSQHPEPIPAKAPSLHRDAPGMALVGGDCPCRQG